MAEFSISLLSDKELLVCIQFTKKLLNDETNNLIVDFYNNEKRANAVMNELAAELSSEEKREQIENVFNQYIKEFNRRNRN